MIKKELKFALNFPPGWLYLSIALAIVYDVRFMLITMGSLTVLFTILKQLGWIK